MKLVATAVVMATLAGVLVGSYMTHTGVVMQCYARTQITTSESRCVFAIGQ